MKPCLHHHLALPLPPRTTLLKPQHCHKQLTRALLFVLCAPLSIVSVSRIRVSADCGLLSGSLCLVLVFGDGWWVGDRI